MGAARCLIDAFTHATQADAINPSTITGDARDVARANFFAFAKAIIRDERGAELPFSAYNHLLCDTLQFTHARGIHLGHMAPPGISKSTTVRAFLLWLLGNDPTRHTVVISAEMKVSTRQVGACRKMILSREYRDIFPEVEPDINKGKTEGNDIQGWTVKEFYLSNSKNSPDPAMAADAANPRSEARRPTELFMDDLMSREVATSDALRKEIVAAAEATWLAGRLSEGGWAVATHNCWRPDDYLHQKLDDWRFLSLWIGVSPDCESLFVNVRNAPDDYPLLINPATYEAKVSTPPKGFDHAFTIPLPSGRAAWTVDALKAKRDNPKTAALFRQVHQLVALTPDDLMFPAWLSRKRFDGTAAQWCEADVVGSGLPVFNERNSFRFSFCVGIDMAGGKRFGDVVTLWGANSHGEKMPIEVYFGQFTIEKFVDIMDSMWRRGFHFTLANVENNSVQNKVVDGIKACSTWQSLPWWGRILPFRTGANKVDPEIGLPSLNVEMLTGMIVWPDRQVEEGAESANNWIRLDEQFSTCPRMIPSGQSPDGVMASWFACSGLTRCAPGSDVGTMTEVVKTERWSW